MMSYHAFLSLFSVFSSLFSAFSVSSTFSTLSSRARRRSSTVASSDWACAGKATTRNPASPARLNQRLVNTFMLSPCPSGCYQPFATGSADDNAARGTGSLEAVCEGSMKGK